ncbi:hypothetical protein Poli38472_001459 [Pythium oligandrum]|uniref:Ankyrin repeat-containing domain n=1 Tax=Pythium oligandrum TaxID=41045 RepID=A0A8K1CUQ4_PYTOL|nr:hypothetical protein Poli38472_001459 [Pythium oligandrum]|eukprot:TMW69303.1 hypothetical protein Poli38472_001459 [Pythium oligandrum]
MSETSVVSVVTNQALLHRIASFQCGLPHALYEFWGQWYVYPRKCNQLRVLLFHLLDQDESLHRLFTRVRLTPTHVKAMGSLPLKKAVERGNARLLAWMLEYTKPKSQRELNLLWDFALRKFDGDFAVLQVLKSQLADGLASCSRVPLITDIRLFEWLCNSLDGFSIPPVVMESAVKRGDLAMIRFLRQHSADVGSRLDLYQEAWLNARYEVLAYLLENHPVPWRSDFARNIAESDLVELLKVMHEASARFERSDDLWPAGMMDTLATLGRLDMLRFLHEHRRGGCTKLAMDEAASRGFLDVVQFLHQNRREGCTTRAMNEAAGNGHVEVVKFLHKHRSEDCTTWAMDVAASNGHFEIVRFLHEHRAEGCTTQAMDNAARNGHFEIVQFLHEHRDEGCTTDAMDGAANGGYLAIVQFLHENRLEGFTSAGFEEALKSGKHDVVRFLASYQSTSCSPSMMTSLLLQGAFDTWLELRTGCDADDGVDEAMREAGRLVKPETVRFLCEVIGRRDLLHLAFEGAAQSAETDRSLIWLIKLNQFDSVSHCHFSEAVRALAFGSQSLNCLSFLLRICCDGSREEAIAFADDMMWGNDAPQLENLTSMEEEDFLAMVDPAVREPSTPDWALKTHVSARIHAPWFSLAIEKGDLPYLQQLHQLSLTSSHGDALAIKFEGTLKPAIQTGRLDIVQWLVEVVEVTLEPTLLETAVMNRKLDIADWLIDHYPDACKMFQSQVIPSSHRLPCPFGESDELVGWLQMNKKARDIVDFGVLSTYAAAYGHTHHLRALYDLDPEAVMDREDLIDVAAIYGHVSILSYLAEVGYTHWSTAAVDDAAAGGHVNVLRFLYKHHNDVRCSMDVSVTTREAMLFLLSHGYLDEHPSTFGYTDAPGHFRKDTGLVRIYRQYPDIFLVA